MALPYTVGELCLADSLRTLCTKTAVLAQSVRAREIGSLLPREEQIEPQTSFPHWHCVTPGCQQRETTEEDFIV